MVSGVSFIKMGQNLSQSTDVGKAIRTHKTESGGAMRKTGLLLLALLTAAAVPGPGRAASEGGMGIIHGDEYAFALVAPPGWMVDTESAAAQGLQAVFYPKGRTWADSPAVAYGRGRPKDDKVKTVSDQVRTTLARFAQRGHDDIRAIPVGTIRLKDGKTAAVYHFTGDQYGNYEAVAYIDEPRTLNFIVLSAADRAAFEEALGPFRALAASYMAMGEGPKPQSE